MDTPEADGFKLPPDASLSEIKKAFRRQALRVHPDHNPDPAAARHFRHLTETYRVLEARAVAREPKIPKPIPLPDRVKFLLADIRGMVKRWPAERWLKVVDGLPAQVWVASILDVLAKNWLREPPPFAMSTNARDWDQVLNGWESRLAEAKETAWSPQQARALSATISAAEIRLKSLGRSARNS